VAWGSPAQDRRPGPLAGGRWLGDRRLTIASRDRRLGAGGLGIACSGSPAGGVHTPDPLPTGHAHFPIYGCPQRPADVGAVVYSIQCTGSVLSFTGTCSGDCESVRSPGYLKGIIPFPLVGILGCLQETRNVTSKPSGAVYRKRTLSHLPLPAGNARVPLKSKHTPALCWLSAGNTHFPIYGCLQEMLHFPCMAVYRKYTLSH